MAFAGKVRRPHRGSKRPLKAENYKSHLVDARWLFILVLKSWEPDVWAKKPQAALGCETARGDHQIFYSSGMTSFASRSA